MRARQLLSIHSSKLLLMEHGEKWLHNSLMKISKALSLRKPPPHTLFTLITCVMSLGLSGLHNLDSPKKNQIITVAHLKVKFSKVTAKSKIALNRLAALVNLPQAEYFTPGKINKLLAYKSTNASTPAICRKINNTHISRLVDTHFNATLPSKTTDINLQSKNIPATRVMPPPQPCSATYYRHKAFGHGIPCASTGIPSLTNSTAHAEISQTNCTQKQQISQSETLYPEPTDTADIKQQIDGPPSKRTRSKCPSKLLTRSQLSRHTYHSGAHLTQQLPHKLTPLG